MKAVKQGEVYLPYDTNFVFAEVNGDRVFWEVEENGQMKVIRVDKKCIGKMISTKAAGSDKRDDITHEYKHPEGRVEEHFQTSQSSDHVLLLFKRRKSA